MRITVLGPPAADGSGRLSPRDRVVLQALATRPGRPVSSDELADALWGDHPPASAAKNLQGCIVRLRKELGGDAITTSAHGYTLGLTGDEVDTQRFERQVARARELLALGEADRVAFQLADTLALWRGPPFPDLPDWGPARHEARRLDELRLEAEELRMDALLRSGRPREVLAPAHAMVRAAPLRERRWTLLALAQYQAGSQGEALRTIHQLRSVLAHELGIDPGPEVEALEQAILRQDLTLIPPAMAGQTGQAAQCPWQGLKAYDVEDADRFFGRSADVVSCLLSLRRTSFLALVGPSGSGKSSILRAGVAASLRDRGHRVVLITPGRHPLESLTAWRAADEPEDAVLAVDQAEEVFSLCEDPAERHDFLQRLSEVAATRQVLVALRADRLSDVTAHPRFSRLVERGMYLVGALDDEGLREAVEGPARQAGLFIEPGLVDLLVREVQDDPGALPLLSHALLETWKRREGNTLTVAGYQASGGIHGAVAQSAERLYARVDTESRHLLRDLVLRLVSPGQQGEPVRTRVARRLIATDTEHDRLIEMLVGARLVTSDDGILEVTHEALARAWPRLRGWLDDDVEGQRTLHHLSAAADAWDTLGRPDSELYRGVRLVRALDWQSRTSSAQTGTERDFLDAGRAAAEAEEQSAAERARAQARLIQRLRLVLTGAVVLLVLALAAGGVAAVQSDRASDSAATARAAGLTALARGVAARASATDDIDVALLLAVAGVRLEQSAETRNSLLEVLGREPALIASTPLDGDPEVVNLDVAPDGRSVATMDGVHRVRLFDLDTGELLAERRVGPERREFDDRRPMVFSPDGRALAVAASATSPQPVQLLDAETLAPAGPGLSGLPKARWQVLDLAWSGDGRTVAASLNRLEPNGTAMEVTRSVAAAWRVGVPGRPTFVDVGRPSDSAALALDQRGRLLYTAAPLVEHDLRTGRSRRLGPNSGSSVELSPDGQTLALATRNGAALLVDPETGEVRHRLPADGDVSDVRFSADGRHLLGVTFNERSTSVWDVSSGQSASTFDLGFGDAPAVDFDRSGMTVLSVGAGDDRALRHWDVTGSRRYLARTAITGLPDSCYVTPASGGEYLSYRDCGDATGDSRVIVDVEAQRARPVTSASDGFAFGSGSFRPGSPEFAHASGGIVRVWDASSGAVLRDAHPLGDNVTEVDHSPDGSVLAVAEHEGRLVMLDADTLEPVGTQIDLGDFVCCISAAPDNKTAIVLVGGAKEIDFWRETAREWAVVDFETGRVVNRGPLGGLPSLVAHSPDGRHAAVPGLDGQLLILDLVSGRPVAPPVQAHDGGIYFAAYSPDGARFVTSGFEGTVAVWEGDTARPLARIASPSGSLSSAEFLPDGRSVQIAPWWEDHAVYVWDTSTSHAIDVACRVAGRDLTRAEWQEHFGDEPYRQTCPQE